MNTNQQTTMKPKHYPILGQIKGNKYRAEIHPQAQVILCSSGVFGGLLHNADTENRAADIAKRALLEPSLPEIFASVPFFKDWLFVEVQTCFEDIRLAKVTGLEVIKRGLTAVYQQFSAGEKAIVDPLILGFLHRLKTEDPEKMDDTNTQR
jgi:hypothetical protein